MMLNPIPVWTSFSRETVQFPLRGFSLLIPLELLTSPSAIMGVLRTPLGLWHPGPGCPSAPGRHSSPLLGVWHSTLHPRLPCWMPSSPFQFWHCMQGSPHPAVCRHPSVAHCVFPGPFRTDTTLAWPHPMALGLHCFGKGERDHMKLLLISKFTFCWGGGFAWAMSPSFAFWK